jgi:hypothetical protein
MITAQARQADLGESNLTTIDTERKNALNRSGIYRRYHDRLLDELKAGKVFKTYLLETGLDEIHKGKGFMVVGREESTVDLFHLMARALFMWGCSVRMTSLVKLKSALEYRIADELEQIRTSTALFVHTFQGTGASPLTPWIPLRKRPVHRSLGCWRALWVGSDGRFGVLAWRCCGFLMR